MSTILRVNELSISFETALGTIQAVDGVSFEIEKGEVFGLVGESGSGKTLSALALLRLVSSAATVSGSIAFHGMDIARVGLDEMRRIRGDRIAMVFQDLSSCLDPVFTVGAQLIESVFSHESRHTKKDARDLCLEYLAKVHIADPAKVFDDYPHQLSGGTRQRIMIAMALLHGPELLILDEPTSSLDMTIQAQILDLLDEVIDKKKMSALFISHDFGVIGRMCDRVAVMRKGRIVESAHKKDIFDHPKDPYTISLLESVKALA